MHPTRVVLVRSPSEMRDLQQNKTTMTQEEQVNNKTRTALLQKNYLRVYSFICSFGKRYLFATCSNWQSIAQKKMHKNVQCKAQHT